MTKKNRTRGGRTPAKAGVEGAPASTRKWEDLLAIVVIATATILVYSNTFDASFHFDDDLLRNEHVLDLRALWPPSGRRWMGFVTFALNYEVAGFEVFGYHLVNLVIHLCNALLVFWLAKIVLRTLERRGVQAGALLRRYLPLTAALLFAMHPLATQAVTYIVQRFASLATLFYVASIALYAKARLAQELPSRGPSRLLYGLSLLAAAAAMKTKEISFTLPFMVAGYELLLFRSARRWPLLAPFAAIALLVPLGVAGHVGSVGDVLSDASRLTAETAEIPRTVYLLTQTRVVVMYLRLLVLPFGQNIDHDIRLSDSLLDPGVLFAFAGLLALGSVAVAALLRARRTNAATGLLLFFGVAWFFLALSVESSIIPIRDVMYEHRVYLPSVGAAIAAGAALLWALDRLRLRWPPSAQVTAALLVTAAPLGVATYARNFVWKDEETLWRDAAAKSPGKWRPHLNLGHALLQRGAANEATAELLAALRIFPHANGYNLLGLAYEGSGRNGEAIAVFREAIRIDPDHAGAHTNLGNALRAVGRNQDAIREYREALRVDPAQAEAQNDLGITLQAEGMLDEAIAAFEKAIALTRARPDVASSKRARLAEALSNLGTVYESKGQLEDAERRYRDAISLAPSVAEAHNNLAALLAKTGRNPEAIEEYRRAVELKPRPEIVFNLGAALDSAGRNREAVAAYERFLAIAGAGFPDRVVMARERIDRLRNAPR